MQENLVQLLSGEDPLDKEQATDSSILGFPLWLSWERIHLQCTRLQLDSWVWKICWRRYRLPILVFFDFPCGSAGKESACIAGDLGSIGKIHWRRERLPLPVLWPGESYGLYSPCGRKELYMTEQLSTSLSRDRIHNRGRQRGKGK